MGFLSSPIWCLLVFLAVTSNFLNFFGHHTTGTKSKQLSVLGGIATWIIFILGFFLTGWLSGIILVTLNFLILGRLGCWLAFLVFKRVHSYAEYLTFRRFKIRDRFIGKKVNYSIEGMLQIGENQSSFLEGLLSRKDVTDFLLALGKEKKEIEDIYFTLIRNGAGEFVANCVVTDPALIREYIELDTNGISTGDITYHFVYRLGGVAI
jgi:hypothetical protein